MVVTVSVTVLTDVLTLVLTVVLVLVLVLVLVDGGAVVVVVVGTSLVVLGAAEVVVGDSVTVWVVSPGTGATDDDGATPDVVVGDVVEVRVGLVASFAVNLTIA